MDILKYTYNTVYIMCTTQQWYNWTCMLCNNIHIDREENINQVKYKSECDDQNSAEKSVCHLPQLLMLNCPTSGQA